MATTAITVLTLALGACGGSPPAERTRTRATARPACSPTATGTWCASRKLPAVVDLTMASDQALCLRFEDGKVACSGARGMADGRPIPGRSSWSGVQLVGGLGVAADVAVGPSGLACVAQQDGALWCWGDPRLYAEQVVQAASPRQAGRVVAATDIVEVALSSERGQSLLRKRDGMVARWRWNDRAARYGVGASSDLEWIEGLEPADGLAISARASCVRAGAKVFCWGQLSAADGTSIDLGDGELPRPIEVLPEATSVAVSEQELCVATAQGTVHCARVEGESIGVKEVTGVSGAVALAAGARHSCALAKTGAVHCWGDNRLAQLGDGAPEARGPVKVAKLPAAGCIASLGNRTCACVADGPPWCWGGAPGKTAGPAW